jgi:hypothetical protein
MISLAMARPRPIPGDMFSPRRIGSKKRYVGTVIFDGDQGGFSLRGDADGVLVTMSAPRAQTKAAFCRPRMSLASASTDRLPMPSGMRGAGIGVPALMILGTIEATFRAPATAGLVTVTCVTVTCTLRSAA